MDIAPCCSIAQAAIAGACILLYLVRITLPRGPQWARPFAQEESPYNGRARRWTAWAAWLLILSILGLIPSCLIAISHSLDYLRLLDVVPWAVSFFITAVDLPGKTPKILLALYLTSTVCGFVGFAAAVNESHEVEPLQIVAPGIALVALLVILAMPMRDPTLNSIGIANNESCPTSELRSPEDNLSLWRFMTVSWLSPLISRGYRNQLNDEDVWLLPFEFQHKHLHMLFRELKGAVWVRLALANGLDLFILSALGSIEAAANLSAPLLLRRLLVSIEKGPEHRTESVLWALAMLALRLISAQSGVFSLWFGRRAYERSRGEMITMVYAKTLARKSYGQRVEDGEQSQGELHQNGHVNIHQNRNEYDESSTNVDEETPLLSRQPKTSRFRQLLEFLRLGKTSPSKKAKNSSQQPATMGKILNLMKSDVYEVAQRFWDFAGLVTTPLQLVLSFVFLWKLLGWSCLLGLAWFAFLQLLNAACIRRLYLNEKLRRTASDIRINATSQFIEAIRPLRWYDWQYKWLDTIMESRAAELHLRVITGLWSIAISGTNLSGSTLFPVFTFFAYTYVAKQPLTVDIAFPALQLFTMLESSLKEIPNLVTVLLNAYVSLDRIEAFMAEPDKEKNDSDDSTSDIEFRDATFAWPTNHKTVLVDLNLRFTTGLSIVCGKVGAGKTALLQSILGELDNDKGGCVLPNQMVGYCAQSPWLQNMSIRDNILFNFPYDPVRYKKVVEACALTPDLAGFSHGDLSDIGENGIGLSGGQRARVALARAVYSDSRVLLLDDPLAALDHGTAEFIVRKLFQGPLMEGRTVILVTHRVDLCAHIADQFVEIDKGRARVLDPDEVSQEINILVKEQEALNPAHERDSHAITAEGDDAAIPDKFIADEYRASGGVVARIYWIYIQAGKLRWWLAVIFLFSSFRFARVFNAWFLKAWGERYPSVEALVLSVWGTGPGMFDNLPSPADNVTPWLIGYAILGVTMTILYILTQCFLLLILYLAAKNLFGRVLHQVSNATFRFYDTTPVGRLMNRLTADIGMLDGGMIAPLQDVTFWSINWTTCMVVIASITPTFFIFAVAMTSVFVYVFDLFIPTSQSLRRLEMVSLSPLMSNFGILLEGLATIRAFKAQPHFQNKNIVITDAFQKMDHFYWSLQAWLQYRFDAISAISTFSLVLLSLYQGLSPGLTAFVLATASQFVEATHGICRAYGKLQMDFVSVERVVELLDLEEEPTGHLSPPAGWPSYGDDIAFNKVTIKYAPHLDPSIEDASFTIPGGATCAVLGRTGSGKSTLALALLATMRPERGSIHVGSIDIAHVDVHAWRQRISFVAQDPVLFPGTLRDNLDPLRLHSDAECSTALHRTLGPGWALDSRVEDGGKNLSQGQRQLIGIGRAVLRRSPVIILDEATASIDKETALAIQDVLRDELAQSTVITIAHRLEAVRDADYFIRLNAGRVVEAGPASSREGSSAG